MAETLGAMMASTGKKRIMGPGESTLERCWGAETCHKDGRKEIAEELPDVKKAMGRRGREITSAGGQKRGEFPIQVLEERAQIGHHGHGQCVHCRRCRLRTWPRGYRR